MLTRILAALALLIPFSPVQGNELHKCRNTNGGVLYSNEPCETQGLKALGPVADRVTVLPASPAPKTSAAKSFKKAGDEERAHPPAAKVSPATPFIERLVK